MAPKTDPRFLEGVGQDPSVTWWRQFGPTREYSAENTQRYRGTVLLGSSQTFALAEALWVPVHRLADLVSIPKGEHLLTLGSLGPWANGEGERRTGRGGC